MPVKTIVTAFVEPILEGILRSIPDARPAETRQA